jgi:ATP-binding cassette subfamily A (ABC1) protein 1
MQPPRQPAKDAPICSKASGCDDTGLEAMVRGHVGSAKVRSNVGTEIAFQMPHDQISHFAGLFKALDQDKATLGVEQYSVSLMTMEEVGG